MSRISGAILGGVLGAVLSAAATQLLFLSCVFGVADAESCGMGIYLLVLPPVVLIGACVGVFGGLTVDSSEKVRQLSRVLGGVLLGVVAGVVIWIGLAVAFSDPSQPAGKTMVLENLDSLSTAASDSLHRAARVEELMFATGFSLPAITAFVGAFLGWRGGRSKT